MPELTKKYNKSSRGIYEWGTRYRRKQLLLLLPVIIISKRLFNRKTKQRMKGMAKGVYTFWHMHFDWCLLEACLHIRFTNAFEAVHCFMKVLKALSMVST